MIIIDNKSFVKLFEKEFLYEKDYDFKRKPQSKRKYGGAYRQLHKGSGKRRT